MAASIAGTTGVSCSRTESASDANGRGGPRGAGLVHGMPAEWGPHAGTLLAWPAREDVWGPLLPGVRADIARIAATIAEYEPVTLLARPEQVTGARRETTKSRPEGPGGAGQRKDPNARLRVMACPLDDLWARDTGPTFVAREGELAGVDLNFNGWGGKQVHESDARVASTTLAALGVARIQARITGEGGAIEVDGEGTALATESSLVNENRNPGRSRDEIEAELTASLGLRKVIWFEGVRGLDVTDCHVDALARFAGPGVVLLSRPARGGPRAWRRVFQQARDVLREAHDANGRALRVIELPEADTREMPRRGPDFLANYVNYYTANGVVVAPRFGDAKADARARSTLRELHPGRRVISLPIDTLAEGGGGIHCATQQIPRL